MLILVFGTYYVGLRFVVVSPCDWWKAALGVELPIILAHYRVDPPGLEGATELLEMQFLAL